MNIDKFLTHYWESFPDATITPKLHMLQDHVVPFLRKWRVGLDSMVSRVMSLFTPHLTGLQDPVNTR